MHRGGASEPLHSLLYRYFFFDWLFSDVSRGSLLERAAAWRSNREMRRYLPVYLRRWLVIFIGGYGMGVAAGDYDDDGDPDLFITNAGPNALLRNGRRAPLAGQRVGKILTTTAQPRSTCRASRVGHNALGPSSA